MRSEATIIVLVVLALVIWCGAMIKEGK